MFMSDTLTLDAPRRTQDGYMAVRAKAARTGVYQYSGHDVDPDNAHGLRDQATVNVLRDAEQVFDRRAVHSFVGKPITDNHPSVSVNAGNWRDHARGTIMGAIREGDHIAFDLLLTDAAAINAVESGKRELSNGYDSRLEFGAFKAADGTDCQARQTQITGNHIAIVDRGRAGPSCRIGDVALCDSASSSFLDSLKPQEKPVKTMLIDGLTVDVSNADTAIATINTILAARDTATRKVTDHEATIATKDRELAAKDTEIADLKSKAEDEATLDARAEAKAELVTKGKALLGDKMPDVKGKSLADTRRAIVVAATNDAAVAGKSDDYIEARFDGLKDAKSDPQRAGIMGQPVVMGDRRAVTDGARAAWLASKENAHTGQAA